MVSKAYQKIEDETAEIQILHDDLIRELSFKLKLDKATVRRVIYQTCLTTSCRPIEVAHIANEFYIHLHEMTHFEEEDEKENEYSG